MTPSEYFKKPVLGKITCRLSLFQDGKEVPFPEDEYEYIGTYPTENGVIYIVNQWNDEMDHKVQLVPGEFVTQKTEY